MYSLRVIVGKDLVVPVVVDLNSTAADVVWMVSKDARNRDRLVVLLAFDVPTASEAKHIVILPFGEALVAFLDQHYSTTKLAEGQSRACGRPGRASYANRTSRGTPPSSQHPGPWASRCWYKTHCMGFLFLSRR